MKLNHLSLSIATALAFACVAQAEEIATTAVVAETAMADTAASSDSGKNKNKDSYELEAVQVTARKREETLQDVPISVSAFTENSLEKLNVRDIGDLQGRVPNLTIYAARGSNSTLTAYIRGIGQADPLWGFDPGVGIYMDDVYIARPQGALLDVFDVERVEVLRGPQGTLYGKNTIGGAIKYISKPLPTDMEGFASLTIGNYNEVDVKAAIGGGTESGVWRGRVAAASLQHDGFGKNLVTGEDVSDKDTTAARASLGFYPNEQFNAQLTFDAINDDSNVRGAKRLAANKFDPAKTPPNDNNYDVQNGMPNVNGTDLRGSSLVMNYLPGGNWTFKSVTAYRNSDTDTNIDFDTLQAKITDVRAHYSDHQFSQELQANYDAAGAFHAVGGIYYFNGRASGRVLNNFLNLSFGSTSGSVGTESVAAYADGTYQFSDALSLSAGLRYTSEKKSADIFNQGFKDATFTTPTATVADLKDSVTFTNVSPRVSLDYHVSPNVLFYGSISRGFKSGGFNIRANTVAVPASGKPFQDEQVDAFEVGSKMSFLEDRLMLNTALFYNRYRDIQLSVFTAYDSNGDGKDDAFFGDFTNAGKAHVTGAEVEFAYRPFEHWTLTGNVAVLDPQYDEFMDRGVNVADLQRFTNAPAFQSGLNLQYNNRVGGGDLTARIGGRYQTKVYPTTDLSPVIMQNEYALLDASVVWDIDGPWSFALNGTNLTNRAYRTTGYNIPVLGILTGFYGAPRQVSATATYSF